MASVGFRFIALSAAIVWPAVLEAQSVASPLTYEECVSRRKELWDESKAEHQRINDTVFHWVGKYVDLDATTKPMYEKANELETEAQSLKCAFKPDQDTAKNGGEQLKMLGGTVDILRQAALSKEKLSVTEYARDRLTEAAIDRLKEDHPQAGNAAEIALSLSRGVHDLTAQKTIDDIVKDRLAELQDTGQAALTVLNRSGEQIAKIGMVDDAATSPTAGTGAASIGNPDGPDLRADAKPVETTDYSTMFANDYASEQGRQAASRKREPAPSHVKTAALSRASATPQARYVKGGFNGEVAKLPPGGYTCLDDMYHKFLKPGQRTSHLNGDNIWICEANGDFARGN